MLASLAAARDQTVRQLAETMRSLDQTRAEKDKALTDLAANEKEAAEMLASLAAARDQAVRQLQEQLAETKGVAGQNPRRKGQGPRRSRRQGE